MQKNNCLNKRLLTPELSRAVGVGLNELLGGGLHEGDSGGLD